MQDQSGDPGGGRPGSALLQSHGAGHPAYFTLWMVTPSRHLAGTCPVDHLKKNPAPLLRVSNNGTLSDGPVLL